MTFEDSMEIRVVSWEGIEESARQENEQRQQIVQNKVCQTMEMIMGSMKGKGIVGDLDLKKMVGIRKQ